MHACSERPFFRCLFTSSNPSKAAAFLICSTGEQLGSYIANKFGWKTSSSSWAPMIGAPDKRSRWHPALTDWMPVVRWIFQMAGNISYTDFCNLVSTASIILTILSLFPPWIAYYCRTALHISFLFEQKIVCSLVSFSYTLSWHTISMDLMQLNSPDLANGATLHSLLSQSTFTNW